MYFTYSLGQLLTGCNVSSDTLILLDGAEIFITETLHTDVLCHGDNTGAISILASGGSGANYTYTWNPSQLTNTTLVNLLAGNYTLTIEDGNNCEQSSVFTIVEPPVLTANITQNGYVLTASNPTGGIAPYSYSWREQSQPSVHLQAGVSYNVYSAGTYYLQVTDGNGCENTDQVDVTINSLPTVGAGADQTVCEGDPVTVSGAGASSYTWDNGVMDGVAFSATVTTTYNVTGVDVEGCENTDALTIVVDECTGIVELINSNLTIYPNPTSDQITIDIKGYNGQVNVEVYDLQGRLLETTTNTIVSLKKHAKGIYVLKVSYGNVNEEVRVVRE